MAQQSKQSQEFKPYEAQKHSKNEIDNSLDPLVREWFYSRFKEFSQTQLYGVIPIF